MIPRLTELQPATAATRGFLADVRRAGFTGDLSDDLATRVVGATDNSIYQILPQAIVYPRTREDVALLMRTAASTAYKGITLTARGGGTGTNGQSLTSGLVVDVGRYMNRIAGRAGSVIEVEPGVVLDQLNAHLAPDKLFFAPNLSPSSRATLGGMISTDASGQGSRVYGKTSQHVSSLEVVLVDGSILRTRPMRRADVMELPPWDASAPLAERLPRKVLEICEEARPAFVAKLPRLARFITGYNLERAWDPETETLDLKWLITGAEGTLGIVTRAWLDVLPIPTARRLAVLEFPSFEAALASAEIVIATNPSSIETIDEKVMDLSREDVIFPSVAAYLPTRPAPFPKTAAINLVEFEGMDATEVEASMKSLVSACDAHRGEPGWPIAVSVAANDADRNALWQLRAKGVGLLGNTPGRRKPVPFVEDTVVPPEKLSAYVAEFRALLDDEGLTYGMFGHVDVGCLHVRPALDLRDPEDEARVRRISDRVAALCTKYGGVIWGEHGKGFRSEYSPLHFGDAFVHVEAIKAVFDPEQRMNPGKIATPTGKRRHLATIDQPTRGQQDRQIERSAQDAFTRAIDCNGNGQCFHWDPDHVMCPSSKITRDRIHTPKGRAGVMREWLRQLTNAGASLDRARALTAPLRVAATVGKALGAYDYAHDVHRAMEGCLACKACATQCPVKVDVPAFRSVFLESYHARYLRPLRDHLVAGLESALSLMAIAPWFFNLFLGSRAFQAVFGWFTGLVDTPLLARRTLRARMRERRIPLLSASASANADAAPKTEKERVVIVQDAFTSFYEPELVLTVHDLLERLGCDVQIAPYFPNGKGLHVKGFLRGFERQARRTAGALRSLAESGATLVSIEPAVGLTYRDEYRHALGKDLGFEVVLLQELLARIVPKAAREAPAASAPRYRLFGHCTEKTLAPASQKQWVEVFARVGLRLDTASTGCCGMSGAFGHERIHREESRGIWDLSWGRWTRDDPASVLTTGYSCRSQAKRFGDFKPRHPAEVLLEHLSAPTA
ncbi:MAG: FAD-binding and (Fe-S)-binding domain-containing protein [Polyangiaceae bacterium]